MSTSHTANMQILQYASAVTERTSSSSNSESTRARLLPKQGSHEDASQEGHCHQTKASRIHPLSTEKEEAGIQTNRATHPA